MALDKDDQVCGYQFLSLGKMMDAIKKARPLRKPIRKKNIGTYGRFGRGRRGQWITRAKE